MRDIGKRLALTMILGCAALAQAQITYINHAQYYADRDQLFIEFNEPVNPMVSDLSLVGLCNNMEGTGALWLNNTDAMVIDAGPVAGMTVQITNSALAMQIEALADVRNNLMLQADRGAFINTGGDTVAAVFFMSIMRVTYFDMKPSLPPIYTGAPAMVQAILDANGHMARHVMRDSTGVHFLAPFQAQDTILMVFDSAFMAPICLVIPVGDTQTYAVLEDTVTHDVLVDSNIVLTVRWEVYKGGTGTGAFVFDTWLDNDSHSVTLGMNNYPKPVAHLALYRDTHLVYSVDGALFRYCDHGADTLVMQSYRLEVTYTDSTFDTFWGYYNPPVVQPGEFYAFYDDSLNAMQLNWWGFNLKPVLYYTLYRDTLFLTSQPGILNFTDWGADRQVSHQYRLEILYDDSTLGMAYADYWPPSDTGGPGLYCGDWSAFASLMDTAAGRTSYVGPADSLPVSFSYDFTLQFNHTGMGRTLFGVQAKINAATDTLVLLADPMDCSNPSWSTENQLLFISKRYLEAPAPNPYFYGIWPDTTFAVRLFWGDLPKAAASFELFRNNQKIAGLSSAVWEYTDMAADPTKSWDYRLLVRYEDSSSQDFTVTYTHWSGPMFTGYWNDASGGLEVSWSGFDTTITGFLIFRNGTQLASVPSSRSSYIDMGADKFADQDYMLVPLSGSMRMDTLGFHYTAQSGGPAPFCGAGSELQALINAAGPDIGYITPADTLIHDFTIKSPPFGAGDSSSGYVMAVLGELTSGSSVQDTMILMAVSPDSCRSPLRMDGRLVFIRMRDLWMPPPELHSWKNDSIQCVELGWSGVTRPVSQYELFRDGQFVNDFTGGVWTVRDCGVSTYETFGYKLVIHYQDNSVDSLFTTYYGQGGGNEPGLFCGSAGMIDTLVQLGLGAAWVVPYDTGFHPFTPVGTAFSGPSVLGPLVMLMGSAAGRTDTMVALSVNKDSCGSPFSMDDRLLFTPIKDLPRPYFYAWYNDSTAAIHLEWGNVSQDQPVSLVKIYRDDQFVSSQSPQSRSYEDFEADTRNRHEYRLEIMLQDSGMHTMGAPYYPPGGGGDDWFKDRKYMVWAEYLANLMDRTQQSQDANRSGLVFNYYVNPDSITDTAAVVTLRMEYKAVNAPSFMAAGTRTVHPTPDGSASFTLYDTLPANYYVVRGLFTYAGRTDTVTESFRSGWVLETGYNQTLTVDLKRLAMHMFDLTANPAITGYRVKGVVAALPANGLYSYASTSRGAEADTVRVAFLANGKPAEFLVSGGNVFNDGLLKVRLAGNPDYVTFDGKAALDISGDGTEDHGSMDTSGPPRTNVLFSSAVLKYGLLKDSLPLPLDTGYRFNTGSVPGKKIITVKAVDAEAGISVEGPGAAVFHLAAGSPTVVGRRGSERTLYYTVGEAVRAGETDIQLPSAYRGMPFELNGVSGVSITGAALGTVKTLIDGSGNQTCAALLNCRNVRLAGLHFYNPALAGAGLEGSTEITVSQCRFSGGFAGLYAFSGRNEGPDTAFVPVIPRRITAVNCIFDKVDMMAAMFETPSECAFVNNTVVGSWIGLYLGLMDNERTAGAMPALSVNTVVNNIFQKCLMGGVVLGKNAITDVIPAEIKSNLFKACDSGNVVIILQKEYEGFDIVDRTLPAANLTATAALFQTEAFPYLLSSASPALNAGRKIPAWLIPAQDFRGVPRMASDSADIGAIEVFALEPGMNVVLSETDQAGYARFTCELVSPGDSGGVMGSMNASLQKSLAPFQPLFAPIRQSGNQRVVEFYPLPDGAYRATFSAFYDSPNLDTTFTKTVAFSIRGGSAVLAADNWSMAGYADRPASIDKAESGLSGLDDSTLFAWDGAQGVNGAYVLLLETGTLTLERGRAYWDMPKTGVTVAQDPALYTAADTAPFNLRLSAGWNMISSPYPFPVSLNRPGNVFEYDPVAAGYRTGSVLKPLVGSWFFSPAADTVTLAYAPRVATPLAKPSAAALYKSAKEWALRVDVSMAGCNDRDNLAGVAPGAGAGFDACLDSPEPPAPMGRGLSAYFEQPGATGAAGCLMESYQAAGPGTLLWSFRADPQGRAGEMRMTVEGARNLPDQFRVYAGTPAAGFTDLKAESGLSLKSGGEARRVLIAVTDDPDFLAGLAGGARLAQNAPNPFNPATRISFTVPWQWDEATGLMDAVRRVSLRVYDVRGREVAVLLDGPVKSGSARHVVWDASVRGRPLSSGVYFCRLACGGKEQVRRMVLMR